MRYKTTWTASTISTLAALYTGKTIIAGELVLLLVPVIASLPIVIFVTNMFLFNCFSFHRMNKARAITVWTMLTVNITAFLFTYFDFSLTEKFMNNFWQVVVIKVTPLIVGMLFLALITFSYQQNKSTQNGPDCC